jgi:dipeptidyl-peptidase 4
MKRIVRILCFIFSFALALRFSFAGSSIPLSLEKIFLEYHFYPAGIDDVRSMADGEHYTVLEFGKSIVSYDYKTATVRNVLFSVDQVNDPELSYIDDYSFSSDEKKILLTTGKTKRYRYSFDARYYIYDLENKKTISLDDSGKQQLATLSPDGSMVAFVKDNNLFFKSLNDNLLTQITTDGHFNSIINGAPDWVYEEEFALTQAYCWSPDSRKIAFYRFDESAVPEFDMTLFHDLYPQTYRFKYPKAGEKNSVIQVRVFDTRNRQVISMDIGRETDQYIPQVKWTRSSDSVCIIRLNRLQNKVDVMLDNAQNGKSRLLFSEENSRFISEINGDYIHFTPDGRYFIIRSERSGYFQYYLYSISGKYLNPVTQGEWDVTSVLGIDDKNGIMFYTSTEESPLQRGVFSVRFDGTHKTNLSCQKGTNSAEFSSTFKYYINTWSNANTPPRITLHKANGNLIRVLEDNTSLQRDLKTYGYTPKKFIRIPVKDGPDLNAYIVLPPDFDSAKVYPLFIKVYGGPEEQDVTDSWDNDLAWQQLLAQHGIITACIDNRGTNGRGEAFRKSTYMQLGKLESEDQIQAALYLGGKNWIDKSRIGIWGWSYGGYMTLLCMTKGAGIFRMGIAVSPVTNWRFYDSIYTERFMRTPQENPDGYDLNSPIHLTGLLKGKLLLVHGTGDDNVHFQNSVELVDQLIKDNKQFEVFYYPNRNHDIDSGNTRFHLFTMLTRYVLENL